MKIGQRLISFWAFLVFWAQLCEGIRRVLNPCRRPAQYEFLDISFTETFNHTEGPQSESEDPPARHSARYPMCQGISFTRYKFVQTMEEVRDAIKDARPGDLIEVRTGVYFQGDGPGPATMVESFPSRDKGFSGKDHRYNRIKNHQVIRSDNLHTISGGTNAAKAVGWKRPWVAPNGFIYGVHGTEKNPIILCGPSSAVFDGSDGDRLISAAIRIVKSSHLVIKGFTLQNALKGNQTCRFVCLNLAQIWIIHCRS